MKFINVILSGGVGSRLWPLSRKSCPKQYVKLFGDRTLFQLTALRNQKITDDINIVGNRDNASLSFEQLEDIGISDANLIVEAVPRNTAPAIAFAALQADEDDILLVTPSDHIIKDQTKYEGAVKRAFDLAAEGNLVTFGLKPTRPETGYGYIEHKEEQVLAFKEKPDSVTAQQYVDKGNYLWNSGIFCFQASTYLNEMSKYRPDIFKTAINAFEKIHNGYLPSAESQEIPTESIDYAVMEQSKDIKVVPSEFTWSDLGSFESLYSYFKDNENGAYTSGKNLILSEKHVELVGLDGICLIETEDAIVVMPKDESQKIKQVYEKLDQEKPELTE